MVWPDCIKGGKGAGKLMSTSIDLPVLPDCTATRSVASWPNTIPSFPPCWDMWPQQWLRINPSLFKWPLSGLCHSKEKSCRYSLSLWRNSVTLNIVFILLVIKEKFTSKNDLWTTEVVTEMFFSLKQKLASGHTTCSSPLYSRHRVDAGRQFAGRPSVLFFFFFGI